MLVNQLQPLVAIQEYTTISPLTFDNPGPGITLRFINPKHQQSLASGYDSVLSFAKMGTPSCRVSLAPGPIGKPVVCSD